jgi:hypothetical protein
MNSGVRDLGDIVSSVLKSSKYVVIILIVEYNYNQSSRIKGYLLMSLKPKSNLPAHNRLSPERELNLKSHTKSTFLLSPSPYYSY